LVIVTGDPTQITPLVATANEKGIKVVTANFPECMEGVITNCNGDNQLNAALAANAFLSSINYKGNTWFVQVPGEPVLLTRERVYKAMAEDFPNVKVTTLNSEHNTAKVQTQIMDVLAANPEKGSIAGIYGSYDLLISAAVEAVRQAGRNEIKMVSIDGDLVAFQALLKEDSPFVASVVQNVPMIGTKAGEALLGAMEGKISKGDLPEMTFVDSYVATRHNVVAAAERRWGPEFWERVGVSKEEVEKQFPQKDELVIVTSVTP
jgi:ribose transport system substrate-binding protein